MGRCRLRHSQKRFVDPNKAAVDGGYEGVMIKDIDAPMNVRERIAGLKQNPFIEVTLKVANVEKVLDVMKED